MLTLEERTLARCGRDLPGFAWVPGMVVYPRATYQRPAVLCDLGVGQEDGRPWLCFAFAGVTLFLVRVLNPDTDALEWRQISSHGRIKWEGHVFDPFPDYTNPATAGHLEELLGAELATWDRRPEICLFQASWGGGPDQARSLMASGGCRGRNVLRLALELGRWPGGLLLSRGAR